MRLSFISLTLIFLFTGDINLSAQTSLFNGCSSAGIPNQPVKFNCDFPETTGNTSYLHYKGQNDADFSVLAMSLTNEVPYYEFTYETNIGFTESPAILEYYFSTERDTLMATQSPKNANDQFPPSAYKYANFVIDPQGDISDGSAGNWLDIRENGMTYSNTRIFCYLKSVTGTYPLGSFPNYFAYSFGFMITSGSDSSFYALVYANIPLILSTGLFKLDRIDSTYTRIGDISSTINGGNLHLACNFTEFEGDSSWPGWPPPEGIIFPMAATLTAGLSEQFVNDLSYPSIFEPRTEFLNFDTNNSPTLNLSEINFDTDSSLIFTANYFDQDNNLPSLRKLNFDSNEYNTGSYDHLYSDTSQFELRIARPGDGWHYFHFEFSDGIEIVSTAVDSVLISSVGCDYLPGDINGNGTSNGIDVTYGVSYLKGGTPPPIACDLCPQTQPFYAAGDINGSCTFNGIDITYFVSYLKGGPGLLYCQTCPPIGMVLSPRR